MSHLSKERARVMIDALKRAGEDELATTLARHLEARARGEDASKLAELWLR
jgi:hypothetical protein